MVSRAVKNLQRRRFGWPERARSWAVVREAAAVLVPSQRLLVRIEEVVEGGMFIVLSKTRFSRAI